MSEPVKKRKPGRPPKYEADAEGVAAMQRKIDGYFHSVKPLKEDGQHPTITGLALALDMGRLSLLNYQGRPEFVNTINRAKERVQQYLENHLYGTAVTGAIFNLKNNYGWKDTQHTENTNTTRVINVEPDDAAL